MKLRIKQIILVLAAVGASLLAFGEWESVSGFLAEGNLGAYQNFIPPVLLLMAAAAIFILVAAFVGERWVAYPAAAVLGLLPYFFLPADRAVLGGSIASILLLLFSLQRVRKEIGQSVRGFSTARVAKAGLGVYFTVSALTVSFYYLAALGTPERALQSLIPRSAFDLTLRALSGRQLPILSQLAPDLPEVRPEMTVDDLLTLLLKQQLQSQGTAVNEIPSGELSRFLASQRNTIFQKFGITQPLGGQERVGDILYRTVVERLRGRLGAHVQYLPFISAAAFFFAFKAVTIPLYFLTLAFVFVLIRFLLFVRILKREKTEVEVEHLTL